MNFILKHYISPVVSARVKKIINVQNIFKNLKLLYNRQNLLFFCVVTWMTSSPCILYFFDPSRTTDVAVKVLVSSLMFALAIFLVTSLSGRNGKFIFFLLAVLVAIPSVLAVSSFFFQGSILHRSEFRVIYSTDSAEAGEFITQFFDFKILAGTGIYLLPLLSFFRIHTLTPPLSRKQRVVIILAVVLSVSWICKNNWRIISKQYHVIDFYRSYYDFKKEQEFDQWTAKRQQLKFNDKVISEQKSQNPKTFVLILGESLSRNHMQLYGYKRETNPRLSSIKEQLYIFSDVISPATITINSMRYLLTFANHNHPDYFLKKRSLANLFNEAGYETIWIGNQSFRGNRYNIGHGVIAKECKKAIEVADETDMSVIDVLDFVLNEDREKDRLVIIHLRGSHTQYNIRYPENYSYFDNEQIPIPYGDSLPPSDKKIIDEYDNSVRFNDYIIYSIIELVRARSNFSWVLYLSDHGEELFEFRDLFGHQEKNFSKYMCEIPFILWVSAGYKSAYRGFFKNLPACINRPYSTENVIHSISELSRLRCMDQDNSLSIFSVDFREQERMVNNIQFKDLPPR